MLAKKTAAVFAVAAMMSALMPASVSAAPVGTPYERGMAEITELGANNIISMYEVDGTANYYTSNDEGLASEAEKLFDKKSIPV